MSTGTPTPFVVVNPQLLIEAADWKMSAKKISLIPTDIKADIETFTNPQGQRASATFWDVMIEFKQSYGTLGSWNVLSALTGTLVTMDIAPEDAVAAVDNPIATFSLWFPSVPFINAGVGQPTDWTLNERCVGTPAFDLGA